MTKLKSFFFTGSGWLTKRGEFVLFWGGVLLMAGPLYLVSLGYLSFVIAFLLFSVGTAMSVATGYAGQAKMFGFQPPFTEDPLGWRRAKRTYMTAVATQVPASSDTAASNEEIPLGLYSDLDASDAANPLLPSAQQLTSGTTLQETEINNT